MIVNDDFIVDKKSFLHKISSLPRFELAGQRMYLACTDGGEKTAGLQKSAFCTSDPVHIQRLVHSPAACEPIFASKQPSSRDIRPRIAEVRASRVGAPCPRVRRHMGAERRMQVTRASTSLKSLASHFKNERARNTASNADFISLPQQASHARSFPQSAA